ncbi:hypothetical protein [Deinococcus peraridilitoris]|uniref:Uncharacterized protein n=1 Tax=Deinococcus peraridilitoris (strain DSM 19664 / LMG 22246 / CIP 109416 / KR-200) TaxID=937777 RepID=L0A5E9_DEIPD|nr:hypothetical protein [Deinococcus peraridilitoris]AFZ68245.1 hypothetical protein Deipe_2781 [Deinococcus peraridilitoris DSM 19664]
MPRKKNTAQPTATFAEGSPGVASGEQHAQAASPEILPPTTVTVHAPLTLIEVTDAADLDALQGDARLAPLIVARVSATVAVALPDKARALLDALRKAGHTPKVSGE